MFSSFCCLLSFFTRRVSAFFRKCFAINNFFYSFDFLPCNFHTVTRHTSIQWPEKKINFPCMPTKIRNEEKKKKKNRCAAFCACGCGTYK